MVAPAVPSRAIIGTMKILTVLVVLASVISCSLALGQPAKRVDKKQGPSSTNPTQKSQDDQQTAERETIKAIAAATSQLQQYEANRKESERKIEEQGELIQGKIVHYTKLLVIVGFLQAGVLIATVLVIYLQVRTARDIERTWILAAVGDLPEIPTAANSIAITFAWPHFTNSGRTPARITSIAIRRHQIPSSTNLPSEPTYQGE